MTNTAKSTSMFTSFQTCLFGRAGNRCKPWSSSDFRDRLRTFKTGWWFAKPLELSPLVCARYGWHNSGPDTLKCSVCSAQIIVKDKHLDSEGTPFFNFC